MTKTIRDFFPVFDFCGYITGDVAWFPFNNPPSGFLECNGVTLSRTTYAPLYRMIGTRYGYTTSTNFRIPDYRGWFLRGRDEGRNLDPNDSTRVAQNGSVGDIMGSEQMDTLKNHTHITGRSPGSGYYAGWDDNEDRMGGQYYTSYYGGNETRPANMYVLFCIKI